MGRNKENIKLAKKQGYKTTYGQLKKWRIKFHQLIIENLLLIFFVDDKAFGFKKIGLIKFKIIFNDFYKIFKSFKTN